MLSCLNEKLSFLLCGSIFSIIRTALGNMSMSLLITPVTTVHGLANQKGILFLMFRYQRPEINRYIFKIYSFILEYHL